MQPVMPEYHEVLPNGTRVHLLPRLNFHQTVAMLSVDFGARDRDVTIDGTTMHLHGGLAHFIEHKIFAQKDYDAFVRLSELGANANAFTTQTRTSYFLSAAGDALPAIQELLTFTQEPYFEHDAVLREADIIGQEIDMYDDDPNSRLYRLILANLFRGDALAEDIAGTDESVHAITVEELQLAYQAVYQPENTDIVIAGNFDLTAIRELIRNSPAGQRSQTEAVTYGEHRLLPVDPQPVEVEMAIVRNKVAFGQRWYEGVELPEGRAALRVAVAISLAFDLVFSEHSDQYMLWYDDGLIDDSFFAEFDWERGAAYLTIAAETAEPEVLTNGITTVLKKLPEQFELLMDRFTYVHRDAIGRLISKFDQLEDLVTRFDGGLFDNATLKDELDILLQLDAEQVLALISEIPVSEIATVVVRPKL